MYICTYFYKNVLSCFVGIHIGPLVYGIAGKVNPRFNSWGSILDIADDIQLACTPGSIQVQSIGVFGRFLFCDVVK